MDSVFKILWCLVVLLIGNHTVVSAAPIEVLRAAARGAVLQRDASISYPPKFTVMNKQERNSQFQKAISRSIELLEDQNPEWVSYFSCFEKSELPLEVEGCDLDIKALISEYLFSRGGKLMSSLNEMENPTVDSFLSFHPETILGHGTCFAKFKSMVKKGRIGHLLPETPAIRRLIEVEKITKVKLDKVLSDTNYLVANQHFLNHYPVYAQIYDSVSSAKKDTESYGNSDEHGHVRILIKSSVLRRLDYHISTVHTGGEFISSDEARGQSFTPFELNQFASLYDEKAGFGNNEIVFRNPISIRDIHSLIVEYHLVNKTREFLRNAGYPEIPVEPFPISKLIQTWFSKRKPCDALGIHDPYRIEPRVSASQIEEIYSRL